MQRKDAEYTAKNQYRKLETNNELLGHSPTFHIHVSVSDFYIPTIDLPILLQEILYVDAILGTYTSATDT